MFRAVSQQPSNEVARFSSQASPCGICGARNGARTDSSPSTAVLYYHIVINAPFSYFIRLLLTLCNLSN